MLSTKKTLSTAIMAPTILDGRQPPQKKQNKTKNTNGQHFHRWQGELCVLDFGMMSEMPKDARLAATWQGQTTVMLPFCLCSAIRLFAENSLKLAATKLSNMTPLTRISRLPFLFEEKNVSTFRLSTRLISTRFFFFCCCCCGCGCGCCCCCCCC